MVRRIDNDGAAYDYYHREAQVFEPVEEVEQPRTFVSYNKIENGVQGVSMGNGLFIHEGEVPHEDILILADDVELIGKVNAAERQKSRMETSMVTEDMERNYKTLDDTILAAEPHFDFHTGKAELVIHYANGRHKTIKKSCYEIAAWLMDQSIKRVAD